MNLRELWAEKAGSNGDRTFLLFRDDRISYAQMHARSNSIANALWADGIRKGDKVAVMVGNRPEFLYVWFGLAKIGAVMVPINTANRGDSLAYVLAHSEARLMFLESRFRDQVAAVAARVPGLKRTIEMAPLDSPKSSAEGASFRALLAAGDSLAAEVELADGDVMAINYTSGTTGPPKGAMIPQAMYPLVGAAYTNWVAASRGSVIYTCLPLFHANAQGLSTCGALAADGALALGEGFSASTFWDDCRRYGAEVFNYVGGMIPILMKQAERSDDADNPVKIAWGAAAPREIWRAFEVRFGLEIVEGYGTTEDSIPLTNMPRNGRMGSIGKPTDLADVAIVDADDHVLPAGEVGEIVVRPRTPNCMMLGYFKMPEETLRRARNLWWHSGDLGYADEDGFCYFVDRAKDCIRRRGENISTFELEKAVNRHPAVLESAAIGVPSDIGEEDVKIFVRLRPGESVKPEDLLRHLEEHVPYFAIPRYVEFVDDFPKTPTERIRKHMLKERTAGESAWDREKAGFVVARQ
jgi:crotonobetaine/carnitine-CoA ligase